MAVGGTLLTFYVLWLALQRNAAEDAYVRRGSLFGHFRSSKAEAPPPPGALPPVPLRPSVARILAQRGEISPNKSASLRAGLTPVEPEGTPPPAS